MSIALTADEPRFSLPRRLVELLPGLALLFAIGFSGKLIEQTINGYGKAHHLALPNIEYVLWAIVIGRCAFPLTAQALGMAAHASGLWPGWATDTAAEATAAGNLWSEQAGKIAVLAKTTRNATIGFVVLGYALYWATKGEASTIDNKAAFLWNKFPKFVLGFLVVSLAATLGAFSKEQAADIANLSRWAFLLTFAGVGLSTDFREMRRQGLYPFLVGAAGEIGIAIVTLGIVIAVQPWLPA